MKLCSLFSVLPSPFFRRLAIVPAVLLGVLSAPARGALLGDYPLQGNFDNAVPGLDALVPHSVGSGSSWSFTSEGWSFQNVAGVGQTGLSLEIPATLSTYSVGMVLQLSHVTAYSKLLDFSGLTSDTGLYVYNNALNLYVGGSSSGGNIESNTTFSFVMTRADQTVSIYFNGNSTPVITIADPSSTFLLQDSLYLLLDDRGRSEYSPWGTLSHVRIWDTALSPAEIPNAFPTAVPEPGVCGLLMATVLGGVALRRIHRNTRKA